eukprot:TRINITY_DN3202_c0_g2_i1.p1 TRINITY_DN3202_c0_g2~~TRINITY_DN3202_c0_g2_i1.p1  ORF type:complete len:134 (+),score=37.19 TRINITY_DN3202_c0_g2_i1:508-909(+)
MGFSVGEKLIERLTRDRGDASNKPQRFTGVMEIIRFISREFWPAVFRKQIDSLKTNHKGVYVLGDNRVQWFSHTSLPVDVKGKEHLMLYTKLLCGMLAGALSNLGLTCTVTADCPSHPACSFTVTIHNRSSMP